MIFYAFLFGLGLGITLACAGFLWLNVKRPSQLDAAEDAFRKEL